MNLLSSNDALATTRVRLGDLPKRRASASPLILLVDASWWPCAPRVALAFQKAGCTTAAVFPPRGHPLQKTPGLSAIWPYSAIHPLESLAAAIQGANPDLIVPCDERSVRHLHRLYVSAQGSSSRRLRELIVRSLGSADSFVPLTSRFAVMETARELGIRVPNSMPVASADDLSQWSARQAAPWLLKADGTWGGHGVRIVNGAEGARLYRELTRPLGTTRFLKRLIANRDPFWWEAWRNQTASQVMAQARVAGSPANSAVACWQGQVLAQICVEVVEAQGTTGPAMTVKVIENEEMAAAAIKLASGLGLSGIVGLDFMLEQGTGNAYFIELNPRCTPLCHLKLGKGRDLVGALAAQLSGRPLRPDPPVTDKNLIAYFPQAWLGNTAGDLLEASFHDVPWEAPDLVQELSRTPWPERSSLARLSDRLSGNSPAHRASRRTAYQASSRCPSSIVPLRSTGTKHALFLLHGADGDIGRFEALARNLDPDRPVYGIRSQALQDQPALSRVEDLAAFYLHEVRALQPRGPYHIVGYSFGSLVAFEMARQLDVSGSEVGLLAMVDNVAMGQAPKGSVRARSGLARHLKALIQRDGLNYAADHLRVRFLKAIYWVFTELGRPVPRIFKSPGDINWFAGRRYKPQAFSGRIVLLQASHSVSSGHSMDSTWRRLAAGGVDIRVIEAAHADIFDEPQVRALADQIQDCLSKQP